jgi:hypothetical protein
MAVRGAARAGLPTSTPRERYSCWVGVAIHAWVRPPGPDDVQGVVVLSARGYQLNVPRPVVDNQSKPGRMTFAIRRTKVEILAA